MIDVMGSDVDLDIREVAVQGPHCSVVGSWAVQCDDSTCRPVSPNAVKHCCTASITKIYRQVQLFASLQTTNNLLQPNTQYVLLDGLRVVNPI